MTKEITIRRIDDEPTMFLGQTLHKGLPQDYKSLVPLWEKDGWKVTDLG